MLLKYLIKRVEGLLVKLVFCTLFDSHYLDKGLVLHKSLEESCKEYELYILPMDEKCGEILKDLKIAHTTLIDYDDFEDEDLKRIKPERSRAEFCWSCTAKLIAYVLRVFEEQICTYIDADMYFYSDPSIVVEEMLKEEKSVQVIRHNFRYLEARFREKRYGKFCVEFNTFLNNEDAWEVLTQWIKDCMNDCSFSDNKKVFGDQKYLTKWPKKYKCVNIVRNQGAGVAPWNINKFIYRLTDEKKVVFDRMSHKKYPLVFFHFHNLRFMNETQICCCDVNKKQYESVRRLYMDYIEAILEKKKILEEKYGLFYLIKEHPAEINSNRDSSWNKLKRTLHENLLQGFLLFIDLVQNKLLFLLLYKNNKRLIINLEPDQYIV